MKRWYLAENLTSDKPESDGDRDPQRGAELASHQQTGQPALSKFTLIYNLNLYFFPPFNSFEYILKLFTCILDNGKRKMNLKKIDFYSLSPPFITFPLMLYGCQAAHHMTLDTPQHQRRQRTRNNIPTIHKRIAITLGLVSHEIYIFENISSLLTSIIEWVVYSPQPFC